MNTPYPLMYRVGFKPWDNGKVPQPLRALAEGPDALVVGELT